MKEQLIKKKKTILLRERKNENICPYAVLKWCVHVSPTFDFLVYM